MRLLFCMMICAKDINIARSSLERIIELMGQRAFDFLLLDDGSENRVGDTLILQFSGRFPGKISCVRKRTPVGYYRLIENLLDLMHAAAQSPEPYDFVVKLDPDGHIVPNRFAAFFDRNDLPNKGIISFSFPSRWRDFAQFFADIIPFGFRRKRVRGFGTHAWEFAGFRKVWWAKHGLRALLRGYWRVVTPGALMLIPGATLQDMMRKGIFDEPHSDMGLIFGDDVLLGILVKSLGHPLLHFRNFDPAYGANLFLKNNTPLHLIETKNIAVLHPLKDNDWANEVREKIRT